MFDTDGDGTGDWWALERGELYRTRLVPGLPTERIGTWPDVWRVVPLPTDPVVLALWSGPSSSLELWSMDGPRRVASWDDGAPLDAMAAGDGSIRLAIGPYHRHLLRLTRASDGSWRRDTPSPSVDAPASDVTAIRTADLDGDGQPETIVALGPWTAYDVRVYQGLPDGPEAHPIARRKLGAVAGIAVVPGEPDRMWVAHTELYPSDVVFPADAPYGEPGGAYLLELAGTELRTVQHLPAPAPRDQARTMTAFFLADLDGDGRDEVIYGTENGPDGALVVHPGGRPGPPLVMHGVQPLFAAQLDDDPEEELVVAVFVEGERRTLILGAGSDALPAAPPPGQPRAAPEIEQGWRSAWERAEELVAMGLDEAAAREMGRLADAWAGHPESVLARRRQAEILGPERSADVMMQLVRASGDAEDHLDAARTLLALHRFEDAAAVAAIDDPRAEELLAPYADELVAAHLEVVGGALPPSVRVNDPLGVALVQGEGLRVSGLTDGPSTLEIPVTATGHRLGFDVDLTLERGRLTVLLGASGSGKS
ncbi:MAG: hypothetical protein KC621_26970, partial [Myxococcales bacterium]|nr:hypothetical protein [Myxococcales bacterium]